MSEEGTTRPSPRAVQRLASGVVGEVSDLRTSLRRALDEAARHEADGRPDRAAAVLAEQQELLAAVHRRLEDRLAGAAVEREAEGVLAGAGDAPARGAVGATAAAARVAPPERDEEGMGLRLLASAVAAVAGVVLLLVPDAGGMLTVAGWSVEAPRAVGAGREGDRTERGPDAARSTAAADEPSAPTPTRPAPYGLPIPEALELRTGPVTDTPLGGPGSDRPDPSPSALVHRPVEEVLDELEDLADTGGEVDGEAESSADSPEGDGRTSDEEAEESPPADDDGEDAGSGGSSPTSDGSSEGEEPATDDGSRDAATGSAGLPPGTAEGTASRDADGGTGDEQDDQQDDQQPDGSSPSSGLGDLATADDETVGAGR